jgi:phosphoglycolate phosphatase-like HAD superfamily hydrolase
MALDVTRARGLCFDVDGTLRDTDDQYTSQLARVLRPVRFLFRGGDPTRFAHRAVLAMESPATFLYSLPDRFGFDNHLARLADWLSRAPPSLSLSRYRAVPGAIEAARLLSARYPLAIVSARNERNTLEFLSHFGALELFHPVATALTCQHTKPYPDPITWVAAQLALPPSALVMIGDTTVDMRAGRAAGAQTVGVLCGFGQENELRRAGADVILPSPAELPALLL